VKEMRREVRLGDRILVKGSRGMRMERLVERLQGSGEDRRGEEHA